jgi:protein-S-isoprenylcysteine O-methyltransferase Ste14
MHTEQPATNIRGAKANVSYGNDAPPMVATRRAFSKAAASAVYYFVIRRRVAISLTFFTLLLTAEGLLGIGWHRVDFRSDILFGAAIALVLLGVGIRSWSAGTIRKNSELATSGAYSLCRHPLYLGSFLMIVGFCLGTQPRINLPIVAPLVVVIYVCAIRNEERLLAQLFGTDWTNYSSTTPRLLPNPLRSKIRLSRWSVEQWGLNREYQAVFGAVAGIAGMFAWYMYG